MFSIKYLVTAYIVKKNVLKIQYSMKQNDYSTTADSLSKPQTISPKEIFKKKVKFIFWKFH